MTSKEIRDQLKPMMNFAPAILNCAQIVEAAEAAEVRVADADKALAERQKEFDAVEARGKALVEQTAALQKTYTATRDDLEKKIQTIRDASAAAQNNAQVVMAEVDKNVQEKRDVLAGLNAEIADTRKRLDQAKQSLKEWAEKNSLKVA